MKRTSDIVIRFVLTKLDGEWPSLRDLKRADRAAPHRTCYFQFSWNPTSDVGIEQDDIVSCEVIYDGVTPVDSLGLGVTTDDDMLGGDPSPILRFSLRRPTDPREFRLSVWESSYAIWPKGYEEPCGSMEDHSGYTKVLSGREAAAWKRRLAKGGYASDKVLTAKQLFAATPLW